MSDEFSVSLLLLREVMAQNFCFDLVWVEGHGVTGGDCLPVRHNSFTIKNVGAL